MGAQLELERPAIVALGLVLACAAPHAAAQDWVNYGESEVGVHYYDPTSIRAEGDRKRVWRLIDRRSQVGNGIKSGKALIEIDCKAGKYRYLKTLQYSGTMGQGTYLGGGEEQAAEFVAPGTMIGHLAKLVC
ncbi:surface-adhesin E family protein [Ramlibacter albus]|uniref:Surface-adhesin protein E-like domain-containing protein n=1 Tax=Ramlibacter albus TaxID=2079448 RepID=A0A923ME16_9BURK|nr:surface-adhesin E family protein [Ramlibacter albus]MBC5767758.1 hypothetical protein [Ramlibacter albus]